MAANTAKREILQNIVTAVLLIAYVLVQSANTDTTVSWSLPWLVGGFLIATGVHFFSRFTDIGRQLEGTMKGSALLATTFLVLGVILLVGVIYLFDLDYNGDVLTGLLGLYFGLVFGAILSLWRHYFPSRSADVV